MTKYKIKQPNIKRGGQARLIGFNGKHPVYDITGRKHEAGGVDIGKDLEVEGGEVVELGDNNITVYSALPILDGISPAELIRQGYNPKKVFEAQEEYKRVNKLNDDGTKKAQTGIRKRLSFDEWYNTIPKEINDTTNYNLRRAYELLNDKTLEDWKNGKSHLPSVIELPNGNYEFLKSKNHPTYKKEIDWYNSEEAKDFRDNYLLDDSTEYPTYRKKAKLGKRKITRMGIRHKAQTGTKYTIQPGDSLSVISKNLTGNANNYLAIAAANNIEHPDKIQAGQELIIPVKFNKPLKKSEIPTSNKTITIDNYSPNYNYIVENDKIYYSQKGRDHWVDISDNETARKNLYNFIGDRYDFRGYEDDEKSIRRRINEGDFNYSAYRDSVNVSHIIPKSNKLESENKPNTQFILGELENPFFNFTPDQEQIDRAVNEATIRQNNAIRQNNTKSNINKIENNEYSIRNLFHKGINWIERQTQKKLNNDAEVSLPTIPDIENSEYGIIPGSFTGDTLAVNKNNRRYIIPSSLDLSENTYGYRNRGDYTEIDSEAAPITTFHNFVDYNPNMKGTYIGIDKDGKLKVGDSSLFTTGDKVSRSFSNIVYEFPKNEKGEYTWKSDDRHGNRTKNVPMAIVMDEKTKEKRQGYPINILQNKNDLKGTTYGNITGGRVIVQVGNEIRLLSGSFDSINTEFENMKKRQNSDHGVFYTLDNGSYNRGLRTYDKKFTKEDLQNYDNQNNGGGNFLYIKGKNQTFPSDTVLTPNIRTKQSESYEKGHSDINSLEGVVLHHTAFMDDPNLNAVTNHFLNPKTEASAHVVIGEDGKRRIFANPEQVTFHAGSSYFNGRDNVNDFMLGIEFQGNTQLKPLTDAQIQSAVEYLKPIIREKNIPLEMITTHTEVRKLYNEYRKAKKLGKQAPDKNDLTFEEYERILNAFKKEVYYKKRLGGKHYENMKKNYQVNINGKPNVRYIPSTGEELKMKCGGRKKAAIGLDQELFNQDLAFITQDVNNNMPIITPRSIQTQIDMPLPQGIAPIRQAMPTNQAVSTNPSTFNVQYNNTSSNKAAQRAINWNNFKESGGLNDLIGVGTNLISSLVGHGMNQRMLNKLEAPKAPIPMRATKLKTRININPQLDKLREMSSAYERQIGQNTASSKVAQNRIANMRYNVGLSTNELYGNKENQETGLINQDRLNQQGIDNQNIQQYNTYLNNLTNFRNTIRENRAEDTIGMLDNINKGVQDVITRREQRRNFNNTNIAMALANPNLPIEMFDMLSGIDKDFIRRYRMMYPKKNS